MVRVREIHPRQAKTVVSIAPTRQKVILDVTAQTQKLLQISMVYPYVEKLLQSVETLNATRRLLLHPELVVIGQQ
jgi:hypothetical protein